VGLRFRGLAFGALLFALGCASGPRHFRSTTIVWRDDDRHPFRPRPEPRYAPEMWDAADNLVFRPIARALAFDTHGESIDVNALDEVPDSSWFENRIGLHAIDPEAVAAGACGARYREPRPPWRVVAGKADGRALGFVFEDADGRRFLLKADRGQPEQSTAADAIGAALYHAVGYHVACNRVVLLDRGWVTLDPGARIDLIQGGERAMTEDDLDRVLDGLVPAPGGALRAVTSEILDGAPLGPWDYRGTWDVDLNDAVAHEDRRELRAMRVLNAWVDHWDARQLNTLSIWKDAGADAGWVEHHVIDFNELFGFLQGGPRRQRRYGHTQWLDLQHVFEDAVTLGIPRRPWDELERGPTWPLLGYFSVEHFDPDEWRPNYWNGAFERMTERDAAWMARILARIGPEHLDALVSLGRFGDPAVSARLVAVLAGRREIVLERYLTRLSPLADPGLGAGVVCLEDLAVSSGLRAGGSRRHFAWLVDDRGSPRAELAVRAEGARVCATLPRRLEPYAIVRVQSGTPGRDAPSPIDVHLIEGRLAGIDRRTDGRLPEPR
jgi:hypothetical protein